MGRPRLDDDWRKWPAAAKQKFLARLEAEKRSQARDARHIEDQGWEVWLRTMGPRSFTGSFASFHRDFWDWYWPLLLAKRDGKALIQISEYLAYLLTLARGMAKSTTVEWAVIAMGAIVGEALALYISSTSKLAAKHLVTIRDHIESAEIGHYYPGLSNPGVGKFNNRYGWNGDMLRAESGLVVLAIGLEEEIRGVKVGNLRPAMINLDDFDGKTDSAAIVKKKEAIIGGSIFGTQTADTIITMSQNLIHANSVARRTLKRRNELLSHRKESGVVKAFTDDFKIELEGTRFKVVKGTPIWEYFDMQVMQKFLDTSGPIETYAEYQHEFDHNQEGKVWKNWDDDLQVITEEEFKMVFGCEKPPPRWYKYVFNDKARTKTEFHANVAGTVTVSSQNEVLPGFIFLYDPLSFEAATEPDDCALEILKNISPYVIVDGITRTWEELVTATMQRTGVEQYFAKATDQINARRNALAQVIPRHVAPLLASNHYQRFRLSHEADDWEAVYRKVFGLPFDRPNPGSDGGLALMNFYQKIDRDKPHALAPYVPRFANKMGYTRFFVIVKNNKLPYPQDAKPHLLHGSDLLRYQAAEHRYLEPKFSTSGEEERGPEKKNDDFTNGLQMLFYDNIVRAAPLTGDEMMQAKLPPTLQAAAIAATTDPNTREKLIASQSIALRKMQKETVKPLGRNRLAAYRRLK